RAFDEHIKLQRAQIRADHALRLQLVALDRKLAKLRLQISEVQAEIEQSPDRHVPRDAGEAVEIKCPHNAILTHEVRNSPPKLGGGARRAGVVPKGSLESCGCGTTPP